MKKKSQNTRSSAWFIRVRGSYLPNSAVGWLTYIPYMAYTIGALVYVLQKQYDFWVCLFILVPNWVAAAAVMNYIAARKSR